jgi:hypothetical protein
VEGDQENETGQETWARSNVEKAHAFADNIANVFQPHPLESQPEEEEALIYLLETPYQLDHQSTVLKELKFKKSSTA